MTIIIFCHYDMEVADPTSEVLFWQHQLKLKLENNTVILDFVK